MDSNLTICPSDIKSHASWLSVAKCYLKCQKVMNTKLAKLELTTAQHELLMHINHKPGSSQQQISDRLLVVKSNTSALLKKLQQRNLIEHRKDSNDARVNHLYLTPAGNLKLKQSKFLKVNNRIHFYSVVARSMRQFLIDLIRTQNTHKRKGVEVTLNASQAEIDTTLDIQLLDLNRALDQLKDIDKELADITELRFFAGLSLEEIAELYNKKLSQIYTQWKVAQAMLNNLME